MADDRPPIHLRAMRFTLDVANGRNALSKLIPPLLFLADALLCTLIIWKIPCKLLAPPSAPKPNLLANSSGTKKDTEIDWVAYMEQVSQIVSGERDYTRIRGGTGPLVYPAAHVYVYTGLYHLTDQGNNILLAQQLFGVVYMATLAVVMGCYWQARVWLPLFLGTGIRKGMMGLRLAGWLANELGGTGPALRLPDPDSLETAA